jgi:hypothetical protein
MFESPQTSFPRQRSRRPSAADAFVESWPNHVGSTTTPTNRVLLEVAGEVVGLVGYESVKIEVTRDRHGYHSSGFAAQTQDPNGIWLQEVRIPKGIPVGSARSLMRIPRLVAMEEGLEWVGCRLEGKHWTERAANARWRTDHEPLLWLFWRESFVDVAENDGLTMFWRNPAF